MQSFHKYITAGYYNNLLRLLAKDRVKQGSQNKLTTKKRKDRKPQFKSKVQPLMPPRNKWIRLRQSIRSKGMSQENENILSIRTTIVSDMKRFKDNMSNAPEYLTRLLDFISGITAAVSGDTPLGFSGKDFTIIPKFKNDDGADAIYRPICVYNKIETKTLISAASAYLTQAFDKHLHEEILSYRPRRMYHGEKTTTDGNDAIKGIKEYLNSHKGQNIYVAECDIQKFFDIINHDVVLDCFDRLAAKAEIPEYHQVRNILKAYLDSYGFVPNVLNLNDCEEYWTSTRKRHSGEVKGKCLFKWVNEEGFMKAYTPEEFKQQRDSLGVPQGGALSCVISNVVLNDVDSVIIGEEDPDRFFARYGDDIILMHTDRSKCEALLEAYKQSLLDHKLIYHNFEDFSNLKDGAKITKKFWNGKSKPVFLWGPGEGNASEWIGFVGYEIRYDGETRLRLSTFEKKFAEINKKYHKCLEVKNATRSEHLHKAIEYMESLPESLDKFSELSLMPHRTGKTHLSRQLKSLDRVRYRKLAKLDAKLSKKYDRNVCLSEQFKKKGEVSYYRSVE